MCSCRRRHRARADRASLATPTLPLRPQQPPSPRAARPAPPPQLHPSGRAPPTPTPSQHRTRSPAALTSRTKAGIISAAPTASKPAARVSVSAARGARNAAAAAPQKRAAPDTVVTGAGRGGGARKRAKVADFGLGPSQESEEGTEEMENQQVMLMRMINTMMAVRFQLPTLQHDTACSAARRCYLLQAAYKLTQCEAHPSVHCKPQECSTHSSWVVVAQMRPASVAAQHCSTRGSTCLDMCTRALSIVCAHVSGVCSFQCLSIHCCAVD